MQHGTSVKTTPFIGFRYSVGRGLSSTSALLLMWPCLLAVHQHSHRSSFSLVDIFAPSAINKIKACGTDAPSRRVKGIPHGQCNQHYHRPRVMVSALWALESLHYVIHHAYGGVSPPKAMLPVGKNPSILNFNIIYSNFQLYPAYTAIYKLMQWFARPHPCLSGPGAATVFSYERLIHPNNDCIRGAVAAESHVPPVWRIWWGWNVW